MKLSDTTHLRLQRLANSRWKPAERLTAQQEAAEIRAIGDAGEPAAVPALSGMLADARELVSTTTVMALAQIMERCGPAMLAQLDAMVREVSEWRWGRVKPTDVPQIALGVTSVLGVLSFNSSGFVREAAVRVLANIHDGQELPFLLIRLNDWVKQVRDAAKEAVDRRITSANAPHFVRCLPLTYRLGDQSREDHTAVIASISDLLRQPESQPSLHEALAAPDPQTRRLAFRVLVDMPGADLHPVLETALASSDPVLRFSAAHELRGRLDGQPLQVVLERLKSDRLMSVRREALYGYVEKLPDLASDVLHAALLDPHPSMREAARFYLRRSGMEDFAGFYRNLLEEATGSELAAAFAGLGETGTVQDGPRLAALLTHSNARVRRAAVRAVGRLDTESFVDALLKALQDPFASVAKAARSVLETHPRLVPPERLWSIFEDGEQPHTRRIALALMAKLGWWDSVWLLITAADSADPTSRERAVGYLRDWQHDTGRLFARPRRQQVEALEQALRQHGAALDQAMQADLAAVLAFAKRELR